MDKEVYIKLARKKLKRTASKIMINQIENYYNAKKLNLPKKIDRNVQEKTGKPVELWIHKDHKYVRQTFKNWEHFTKWTNAQSRSIRINTMTRNGKNYVTCDFLNKKEDAKKYEDSLCL